MNRHLQPDLPDSFDDAQGAVLRAPNDHPLLSFNSSIHVTSAQHVRLAPFGTNLSELVLDHCFYTDSNLMLFEPLSLLPRV